MEDGKKSWSIEVGYHKRPDCVEFWMPIPETDWMESWGKVKKSVNH